MSHMAWPKINISTKIKETSTNLCPMLYSLGSMKKQAKNTDLLEKQKMVSFQDQFNLGL